jgi:uracil-DNA glycosylase
MSGGETFADIWADVATCTICRSDRAIASMLAEEPFVPFLTRPPRPEQASVRFMLVGMEPGTGWTSSEADARDKIRRGARCFNTVVGDYALQYAAERWLLRPRDAYVITNLGKCCVGRAAATATRARRYLNCAQYLERELQLFQPTALIALGKEAKAVLDRRRQRGWPLVFEVIHHSPAGTPNWPTEAEANAILDLPTLDEFQASLMSDPASR